MGYKLAGFEVIGNCEIDPRVAEVYKANLHPKFFYNLDIRDFNKLQDIPEELKNIDILDGSPPCSVFSMAGKREDGWNREKVFREGQKKQKLDDLFFHFLDTAEKLKPKVVVAENVEGIIIGNAKGYVNEIIKRFNELNYVVQIFLLNAATMGVPQARKRVFFIAHRKELKYPKLSLNFNEKPILFGQVREENGIEINDGLTKTMLQRRKKGDCCLEDISKRERGKSAGFTNPIISDDVVAPTITSGGTIIRFYDGKKLTNNDFISCQTFPQDYQFYGQPVQYICGMSVPPVMMANIATEINNQWFETEK